MDDLAAHAGNNGLEDVGVVYVDSHPHQDGIKFPVSLLREADDGKYRIWDEEKKILFVTTISELDVAPDQDMEIALVNVGGKVIRTIGGNGSAKIIMRKDDPVGTVYSFGRIDRRNKLAGVSSKGTKI